MTRSGNEAFRPVELPAGQPPRWEQRYPGRLRYELDALQGVGITPEVDADVFAAGRVLLSLEWPLDAHVTLGLRITYPDSFPHTRPQVFIVSGLESLPERHVSPIEGNVCLLGRDTRQWMPSWTLCKLLQNQLKEALLGGGDEDPQGEPAEYWWNALNRTGSFCLIDSAWDFGSADKGTLLLRYADRGTAPTDNNQRVPVISAYVETVRDEDDHVLHEWSGALPPVLAQAKKTMRIPWVRLQESIVPERDIVNQMRNLRDAHLGLQTAKPRRYQPHLLMDSFAIIHPSELNFGEMGLGWVIYLICGHPKAFAPSKNPKKANKPKTVSVLPVYRAGQDDIGFRVPAVSLLREKKILVVGLGAIGAPIAVELARNSCGTLELVEYDTVEPGNTVRWPLGAAAWGKSKLNALGDFLAAEYPATAVATHHFHIGQVNPQATDSPHEDEAMSRIVADVDLVMDASASYGVTSFIAEQCRVAGKPLLSVFATPPLQGGAVALYDPDGGCPVCLEYAWEKGEIKPPPGLGSQDNLIQPPGCAERTFVGAGYDLQELSLQTVRLAVETLSRNESAGSVVHTLGLVNGDGNRCPPRWRIDPLPKRPECRCRS